MDKYYRLADLLLELEKAMREAGVWDTEAPSDQAKQSTEPFCIDTMGFDQWLRYVMIERFKIMIEHGMPLPGNCDIAPLATEFFKNYDTVYIRPIVKALILIDQHLSAGS